MINFTNCPIDKLSDYGGSDQKRAIIYNNKKYMLKMSDRINTEKRNSLNSSYSNSTFSEHVCCQILKNLGFSVQNTLLGYINLYSPIEGLIKKPVVACENFVPDNYKLIDFKTICNNILAEKPGRFPKIEELEYIFSGNNIYFDSDLGQKAKEKYWDEFILDALLGNFDRHGNNFAYFINIKTNELIFTPIFDCGSCLYPQISDDNISNIINSNEEINKRINDFPKAALEYKGTKVNYRQFINNLEYQDCNEALLRIFPKIDFNIINSTIDSISELTSIRKTFYKTMLKERYEKILEPAYQKLMKHSQNLSYELENDSNLDEI